MSEPEISQRNPRAQDAALDLRLYTEHNVFPLSTAAVPEVRRYALMVPGAGWPKEPAEQGLRGDRHSAGIPILRREQQP